MEEECGFILALNLWPAIDSELQYHITLVATYSYTVDHFWYVCGIERYT